MGGLSFVLMKKFRSENMWYRWISGCFESASFVSFSVIVNVQPCFWFRSSRGGRQGFSFYSCG